MIMEYPQQPVSQFQPGMNGPVSEGDLGSLKLNYWLSVFFSIIPALIFYFIKKGRNQTVDSYLKSNLIFSAIRFVVGIIYSYFSFAAVAEVIKNPEAAGSSTYSIITTVMMLLGLVLFVVHIVLAATLNSRVNDGKGPMFLG